MRITALEYFNIRPYYESHKNVYDYVLKSYVKSFSFPKDNAPSIVFICFLCFCGIYFSNDYDEISSNTCKYKQM